MAYPFVYVHYDRTDLGAIYLRDVGQRSGLGGGKGIYTQGQDRYISHGQDATLFDTGDVLLSRKMGVIKNFDGTAFTVA